MPFKSLINIRSICPLAEIQRPENANEWESKAIRVHYRVPLVSSSSLFKVIYWQAMQTSSPQLKNTQHYKWSMGHMCFLRFQRKKRRTQIDYGNVFHF